jgi:group I intron endonuclease
LENSFIEINDIVLQNFILIPGSVKIYENFYKDRGQIRKDHKGKKYSRIYIFFLLNNPSKCYIGQSTNLLGRLNNYLNNSFLQSHKNSNSPFISALLKYTQSKFGLIILEYVEVDKLNEREMYWIKILKPYYNVLRGGTRGSRGFVHSEETKNLIKALRLGTKHSEKTKSLISKSLTGYLNPFYGKIHTDSTLLGISNKISIGSIYIYSLLWEPLLIISSIKRLAIKVNSNFMTIKTFVDSGKLFRGGWYFMSQPVSNKYNFKFSNQNSSEAEIIFEDIKNSAHIRKAVFVYNAETKEFIRKYDGIMDCAKDLKISHNAIKKAMINNTKVNNYLFSAQRIL